MAHTEIPYHLILMIGHKQGRSLSLGVVLWEISSGKLPCEGCTQSFEVFKYRQQGYRDPSCSGTPEAYIMLYSQCWNENPDNRPLCEEIHSCLSLLFNNKFKQQSISSHNGLLLGSSLQHSEYNTINASGV